MQNTSPTPSSFPDLDTLWSPLDPKASETLYLALLPQAEQLTGSDRAFYIELLTMIAKARGILGNIAEANIAIDQAEKIFSEDRNTYRDSARIRWLLERGRLFVLAKTPAQARALFSQAWALAVNAGEDFFTVDIAQMMAKIEPKKLQQDWIDKAIQIAEDSPNKKTKSWLGGLYTTLGWQCFELRQYDKALLAFQKSLGHLRNSGTPREIFLARWSAGKVLRMMDRLDDALDIQRALEKELGSSASDGRLFEEIAECLQALNQNADARPYFELAYAALSRDEWVADNQPVKLKRLKDLGKVK
jgi:tetratricopeptide (TPR) repeat protein